MKMRTALAPLNDTIGESGGGGGGGGGRGEIIGEITSFFPCSLFSFSKLCLPSRTDMGHTGIVRFPGNLDPRAQEFRPNLPCFPSNDFPLLHPHIYYPYPSPYPPREHQFTPLNEFTTVEYPQFTAPQAYVRAAAAADPPLPPPLPPPSATPSRTLLLSSVPADVSESIIRRELEVFGDVRAVQMERVRSGIVTVHFYDLRHAQCALAEIQDQHMQQQCRLRNHFDALLLFSYNNYEQQPTNHFLAPPPLPPPARGLISSRAVWAQFTIPVTVGLHEGSNQGTIVIFNLEPAVTTSKLMEIFQPFGAIKELRETPLKRHQRFVEFYDVRDAAKALSEMNGKEVNGKAMVIEFSRPGGGHHKKFSKPTIRYNNKFNSSANYTTTLQTQVSQPPFCRSAVIVSPSRSSNPRSHSLTRISSFGMENPNGRYPIINSGGGVQNSSGNLKEDESSSSKSRNSKKNARAANNNSSSCKGGGCGRHWKGSKAAKDQKLLLNMLDNHCIHCNEQISDGNEDQPLSSFDFVYLPIDFINKCNVGYGFVNMTSPEATLRLYKAFHHQSWEVFNSRKICEVTYARLQGLEALKEHFKNSKFPCETGDYLPVLFSPPRDGRLLPDPTPIVARPLTTMASAAVTLVQSAAIVMNDPEEDEEYHY
ncbi:hypothetical protein LguiB_024714 [Lonicera macranthoides]